MPAAFALPLGLMIGSFLNVVAYRLPRGESLVRPRSRCTACGANVRSFDNVPVLSWLILRGRCRGCRTPISARYPIVELLTGLVFAAIAIARGPRVELLLELPFAAMLIALASIDLEHRVIPNKILLPMAVFGLVASALVQPHALPGHAIAAGGSFAFFLIAALAYPGGMGMGDVKLAGVMGLYLGLSVVPAMVIAFFCGTVVGLALLVRRGAKAARKSGVPFAPFMALGGLVALLAGHELVDFYVRTFIH